MGIKGGGKGRQNKIDGGYKKWRMLKSEIPIYPVVTHIATSKEVSDILNKNR